MNYSNTTNVEAVPMMDKRASINEMLCVAKDEGFSVLALLTRLHNFLFAEEKPTDPPQMNIKCMYECVATIRDTNEDIQFMLTEICERLGL